MPLGERNARPGFQIAFKGDGAPLVGELNNDIDGPCSRSQRAQPLLKNRLFQSATRALRSDGSREFGVAHRVRIKHTGDLAAAFL